MAFLFAPPGFLELVSAELRKSLHYIAACAMLAEGRSWEETLVEQVRIGILGCARICRQALIEAVAQVPEVEIVAVASRDAARAQAYANDHGIRRAHGGYEALLADDDVEVVYNPLPNSLHAEWTINALSGGKAVLCEKPLASNAAQAGQMVAAARRADRPLIEAFHYRHHPVARFIAEHVRSGELGRLRQIDAILNIPGRLLRPDDIRFQEALAGGATMDVGSYCINILRLVAGVEPTVISASASTVAPRVDGAMRARLAFLGETKGSIECSLTHESLVARLSIEGERGGLVAENPFLPQLGGSSVTITVDGEARTEQFDRTPTYVFQLRSLVDVIRNGAASPTPAEDGVANMKVIDAVYTAAGLGLRG
jgi:predicted dehydrogenase